MGSRNHVLDGSPDPLREELLGDMVVIKTTMRSFAKILWILVVIIIMVIIVITIIKRNN